MDTLWLTDTNFPNHLLIKRRPVKHSVGRLLFTIGNCSVAWSCRPVSCCQLLNWESVEGSGSAAPPPVRSFLRFLNAFWLCWKQSSPTPWHSSPFLQKGNTFILVSFNAPSVFVSGRDEMQSYIREEHNSLHGNILQMRFQGCSNTVCSNTASSFKGYRLFSNCLHFCKHWGVLKLLSGIDL